MKIQSTGYYVNRHSCFLLQYHLVLVTKYRKPAIVNEIEVALTDYTKEYFATRGIIIHELNADKDHLHILFDAPPQINLAEFVNAFKSASSRYIQKNFKQQLSAYYWKPHFWSLSYFISSVSDRTASAVKEYIKNQKLK